MDVTLNLAGDVVVARLAQDGGPEIFRDGKWERVYRLVLKCGHTFTDEELAEVIKSKL